jgi:hypothetical protein
MKEYKVGQILYLMSENSTNIIPIQVIEEVVKTTIAGQEKTYTIQLPDKKKTTADISTIKGSIFRDPNRLKSFMIKNATDAIIKIVNNAANLSETAFDVQKEEVPSTLTDYSEIDPIPFDKNTLSSESMQQEAPGGIIKVDLGNGNFGNMKVDNLKSLEDM